MARWRNRPDGSTWGDFGPDDRLGRLNLVGPDQVRKGVAEVRDGITFCLSLPLDLPGRAVLNPNRLPPVLRPALRSGAVGFNCDMTVAVPGATDVMCDDLVVLHTQYSTQWDAFGHAGSHFDADGDVVGPGDFLVLHTGFTRLLAEQNGRPDPDSLDVCAVLDGADPDL